MHYFLLVSLFVVQTQSAAYPSWVGLLYHSLPHFLPPVSYLKIFLEIILENTFVLPHLQTGPTELADNSTELLLLVIAVLTYPPERYLVVSSKYFPLVLRHRKWPDNGMSTLEIVARVVQESQIRDLFYRKERN